MMNKVELKILMNAIHQIKDPREENIFSYFMGFSEEEVGESIGETRNGPFMKSRYQIAQRYEDTKQTYELGYKNRNYGSYTGFIELIKTYLSKTYPIDKYNDWIEQIDHYAFIKELNWTDGFYMLLKEIYEKGNFSRIPIAPIKTISFTEVTPKGEEVKELIIKEKTKIKVGDIIKLGDLIGDAYLQTKYYDMSIRNPSWELFRPSDKDFKFIKFFNEDKRHNHMPITYGKVWRIFSGLANTVLSIKKRNKKYFIYTEIFEIDVVGAMKRKEMLLSRKKELPRNACDINENIKIRFEYYRMGLTTAEEFLLDFPFYDFSDFRKDWQIYRGRFMVGIGRRWTAIRI